MPKGYLLASIGFIIGLISSVVHAEECGDQIENMLLSREASSTGGEFAALNEVHSLWSLVDPNPEKNLAVQHPAIILNSFQRYNSWIFSEEPLTVTDPLYGVDKAQVFPVFAGGLDVANGRMIVGQLNQIEGFANYIRAGAVGDGSRAKMPVFTGPSGTGKSEFLTILDSISSHYTTHHPDYFLYTYRWKNLREVPALRPYIDEEMDEVGLVAPIKRSPFVLLPKSVQDKVINLASKRAREVAKVNPDPVRHPDPISATIRDAIIENAKKESGKAELSEYEVVEALEKHIDVVRLVYQEGEASPKLGAQGKDIRYDQIFFSENALNYSTLGPENPFSYFYNGKVLSADGRGLLLDEWYRNPSEFRDTFLDIIEDRVIQRGGSPAVFMDLVIFGATNDESIDASNSKGTSKAHRDRSNKIPMRLSIIPMDIAKTMMLMKGPGMILQRPLQGATTTTESEEEEASKDEESLDALAKPLSESWETGRVSELYPIPLDGKPLKGPDGRFAIAFKTEEGKPPVFVAPHTIRYMAYLAAATRFKLEVEDKDLRGGGYTVINSEVFADPVARLKLLAGDLPSVGVEERRQLKDLHYLLQEGDSGISQRDLANGWLTKAIAAAQTEENGYTLTPTLVKKVFNRLLDEGSITYPDTVTMLRWKLMADRLSSEFVVSWIEKDIMTALHSGEGNVKRIYNEVRAEIFALSQDSEATKYVHEGRTRSINKARLREIKDYYYKNTGKRLIENEVMTFHSDPEQKDGKPHEGLYNAILKMVSTKATELVSYGDLAAYGQNGQGQAQVGVHYQDLMRVMIEQLGYNQVSAQRALELIYDEKETRATDGR